MHGDRTDREKLHAILWEHRKSGVTESDIAGHLGVDQGELETLLCEEEGLRAVRCDLTDDDVLGLPRRYFSNRLLAPPAGLAEIRCAESAARAVSAAEDFQWKLQARRDRRWVLSRVFDHLPVGVGLIAVLSALWLLASLAKGGR